MKFPHFVFFFAVILLIYASVNLYLLRRTGQALEGLSAVRAPVLWTLFFLVLAFPAGRLAEYFFHNGISGALVVTGSLYLGVMFYAVLLAAFVDLLRLGNHFFRYFPASVAAHPSAAAHWTWAIASFCVLIITAIGHYNAVHPHYKNYDLTITKKANGLKELNIVAVSDMHLGTVVGTAQLNRIIGLVRGAKPDLVLFVGDIFDIDVSESVERNTAAVLKNLQATYGVFAVTGNHEYYAGVDKAVSYLERAGVTVLQDSAVRVAGAFYLIGRKDLAAERMGKGRATLDQLLVNVDRGLPLILMDHQPFHLEAAQRCGIDLQLSGHTHYAQLFPLNLFYGRIYELPWGILRKGNSTIIVSCGAGTWGPPVRTSAVPEVVRIRVTFGNPRGNPRG
jgi:predicted MPP superfamily phosphohydrolase